jgi:adenylylsulfate kinase-like enzyme
VKRVLLTGMSGTGKSSVEPLLRKAADHEIRTTMPLGDVVTAVLRPTGV